jgi:hypothetical protein
MKKLNTSAVSTTNGLPVKAGSLVHIQSAYTEVLAETLKGVIGADYSPTAPYRVAGLINTAGAVSAGSIFYGGEVYLVDAFSLPSPANAALSTTYFTDISADPVAFTDGTPRNIHEIRKIVFGATVDLGFTFTQLVELDNHAWVSTNATPSPVTVLFDKPRRYFRSFSVTSETALTITLDGTGARDGVETIFMFQTDSPSASVSFTHNVTSGITDIIGVGGYTNPLVISVGSLKYFIFRYKLAIYPTGPVRLVSLNVTEAN